jgi:hypothetical protein
MHTLLLLTVVLSSLAPNQDASIPSRLELRPPLTMPSSQRGELHLLDSNILEESDEDSSPAPIVIEFLAGLGGPVVTDVLVLLQVPFDALPLWGALVAVAAPALLGPGLGVYVAGRGLDRSGHLVPALLGGVIGLLVAAIGMAAVSVASCDFNIDASGKPNGSCFVPAVISTTVLSSVGATLGYELSAPTPWLSIDYASRAPSPTPRFVPVLALTRQGLGATLGIAGTL